VVTRLSKTQASLVGSERVRRRSHRHIVEVAGC
jgi:hypothetical protein